MGVTTTGWCEDCRKMHTWDGTGASCRPFDAPVWRLEYAMFAVAALTVIALVVVALFAGA